MRASSGTATDGPWQGVRGPNFVDLMVSRRVTSHMKVAAIQSVVLKVSNFGVLGGGGGDGGAAGGGLRLVACCVLRS